jgi:HAD superfamily hydrolase (TIGR01509 family)
VIEAVILDLDGVLIDSEQEWARVRREVANEHGGAWKEEATRAMMGMSSPEWSQYMHSEIGVELPPAEIVREVLRRLERRYREHLPLMPGAAEAVRTLASRWRLGLASSANREIIALVLEISGWASLFAATVSSEEVPRGKPAPDVYLEAARRLGVLAARCAAVEDSTNGLRSAAAAGMRVIAVPNRAFPPTADALALADAEADSLGAVSALLQAASA